MSSIAAAGGWLVVAVPAGLFVGLVGLLQVATGYGLWKLEPLAYPLAMGLFVLSAITDLASGNVYGAGLSAINAYILYHYRDLF